MFFLLRVPSYLSLTALFQPSPLSLTTKAVRKLRTRVGLLDGTGNFLTHDGK